MTTNELFIVYPTSKMKMTTKHQKLHQEFLYHLNKKEETHFGYLDVYFKFAYFSLLFPFDFKKDPTTAKGTVKMYTNRSQEIAFGVIQLLALSLMILPTIIETTTSGSSNTNEEKKLTNSAKIDRGLATIINIALVLNYSSFILKSKKHFKIIMEQASLQIQRGYKYGFNSKIKLGLFAFGSLFRILLNSLQVYRIYFFYESKIDLMIKDQLFDTLGIPFPEEEGVIKQICVILGFVIYWQTWQIYTFMEWSLLFISVILSDFVDGFLDKMNSWNSMKKDRGNNVTDESILEEYKILSSTIEFLNMSSGGVILQGTFGSVGTVSQYFSTMFISGHITVGGGELTHNIQNSIRLLFFIMKLLALIIAAKANNNMLEMNKWILENRHKLNSKDLQVLTHEISRNDVALSPFGLFKVDYSFLGTFLGIVLSYAVMMAQF